VEEQPTEIDPPIEPETPPVETGDAPPADDAPPAGE